MYVNAATGIGNIQYDSNAIEADWSIIFQVIHLLHWKINRHIFFK